MEGGREGGEGVGATSKLFWSLIRQCGLLKDSNTTANSSFQSNCPARLSWIPSNYSQHRLSGVEIIMKNILSIYFWLLAAVKCPVIQYSQGCLPCLCRSWFKQPIRSTALHINNDDEEGDVEAMVVMMMVREKEDEDGCLRIMSKMPENWIWNRN